jgi:hypothetical protein
MDYRKKVLEYFGATVDHEYQSFSKIYDVQYVGQVTADGYEVFHRIENGEKRINWDADVFYYAESCIDSIVDDLERGCNLYIYEDIASECGLEEDGYMWEDIYNKYIGNDS